MERSACPTCGSCSGMFTANSMNCLTEALGLSLPGNGSVLATHADRKKLFLKAGRLAVELCETLVRARTTPRCCRARSPVSPPSKTPSRSTSPWAVRPTPCCTCWRRRRRAAVNFTMADIDRMSRKVPCLAKVAPATQKYHMEDVHRAGGIMAILGELDRAGLINRDCPPCTTRPWASALDCCDVKRNHDGA
jgi:dihydroxy-acid dehydratase